MKNATVVLSVVFQLNREWMITALLQGFSNDISFLFFITENVLSTIGVRAGGARGAPAPPNFGQLRFFGQREKIWAEPVF